jgi:hypothetical protein
MEEFASRPRVSRSPLGDEPLDDVVGAAGYAWVAS